MISARYLAALGFFCAWAVSGQVAPVPASEWPRSTPEAQGLDEGPLNELVELIRVDREYPDLHSLVVVRNGYLIVEEYFAGWSADRLHPLQSVTKSFQSALIGIAIGRGEIEGVEERVLDFFPNMTGIENVDDRKRRMRLEDLLTMRSGTDYREGYAGSPHSTLNGMRRGWDRFILGRPMLREPGTHFQYDSGGVILMSAILKQRTGMHADEYADRYLFPKIGVERADWFRNADGHPHTGGGLDLRPRDMARFGLLYLREGRWGDEQVVPASWVEASIQRHVTRGRGHEVGYGYLWWLSEPDPAGAGSEDIYSARGFRGQYIFVVPEHDLVVVVTGGTRHYTDEAKPVEFLYSHVLPAVRGPAALASRQSPVISHQSRHAPCQDDGLPAGTGAES